MKGKKVLFIARFMEFLGINTLGLLINSVIHKNKYIRVINYHSTPKEFNEQFEKQMLYYNNRYCTVSKEELNDLLNGEWKKNKPGLIITFDDGLESNYKYAKPILEKYGFQGWFFVPSGLIGTGNCRKEHMTGHENEKYMEWDQVKDLQKRHIVGCHTLTHTRLNKNLDSQIMKKEVYESKKILERMIYSDVDIFCWVGGEKDSYSKKAYDIIKTSGYKYSFLTNHYPVKSGTNPLQLERTNIEADWPIYLIKFYTSAFMDLKYLRKRKYTKKIIQ